MRSARPLTVTLPLALALIFLAGGCGTASTQLPAQSTPSPPARVADGRPSHIAVILMENEEYGSIVGSSSAPYINRLARRYALASEAFAVAHPSLPNYLALTGGATFGIDSDCTGCSVPGTGLAGQLSTRGISWKAYMEDLPRPCFTGAEAGEYAKKHDPFAYYRGIVERPGLCARIVPLSELSSDERSHDLPALVWITPNLCNDMHDCSVATGDRFLSRLVPPLLQALGRRGLLVLTWDEGSSDDGCCRLAHGGHITTIVAGGEARAHARTSVPVDHYSVLRTIEDLFGLPRLGGASCPCTPSLAPLLRRH